MAEVGVPGILGPQPARGIPVPSRSLLKAVDVGEFTTGAVLHDLVGDTGERLSPVVHEQVWPELQFRVGHPQHAAFLLVHASTMPRFPSACSFIGTSGSRQIRAFNGGEEKDVSVVNATAE
jgi:hypothetical protein